MCPRQRLRAIFLVLASACAASWPARASAEPGAVDEQPGSLPAVGASLVPGVLLHGSGHYALGRRGDGLRLLLVEGVGLVSLAAGVGLMIATGASDDLAVPYLVPSVAGVSLVALSFATDVLGVAHGTAPWPAPHRPRGTLFVSAGYLGLYATPFDFAHHLTAAVTLLGDRASLRLSTVVDPAGVDYWALRGRGGIVLWPPASGTASRLSLFLDVGHQQFRADRFRVLTAEAFAELRLDLGLVVGTMRNAYVLTRLGAGVEGVGVDALNAAFVEASPLLVLDFGLGLQATRRVGLEIVYHQQKNELPGGLIVAGSIDGMPGMLELEGRVEIDDRWAILPGLRYGGGLMPWIAIESRVF